MSEKNAHIDYELMTKYFAGEANDGERRQVEEWRQLSNENVTVFRQMEQLWKSSGRVVSYAEADVDTDKGWEKLKNKYTAADKLKDGQSTDRQTKTRSIGFYLYRVAAVLIVGLVVYTVYQGGEEQPKPVDVTNLVALGNVLKDTLPDGSEIALNRSSSLSFSQEFGKEKRDVSLQGEAFFKVAKDENKPFTVTAGGIEVAVVGTSFYVKTYDSLNVLEVHVKEGKVKVSNQELGDVLLEAGESFVYDKTTREKVEGDVYDANAVYWNTKTLIFQNDDLTDVFDALRENYRVGIEVKNGQILSCRLTAKFTDERIDHIFEVMESSFDLTYEKEGNNFTVAGNGCN